jgi:predicted DNA-binding transcriptional regulator YafY
MAGRSTPAARSPSTRPPLRRLMWAINCLKEGRSLKATDLAREFEVNVRTAYRDMDFLRDSWRVPLEFDRGRGTYCLTEPYTDLPPVTLSQGELVSLYFAEKVMRQYRGTPFEADLVSAFRKMQELLPQDVRVSPDAIDGYLSLDLGPLRAPDASIFASVLQSQRQRRKLLIRYKSLSSNRTAQRRIHPLHVFNNRGDWYVAAWDEPRKDVRIFALHRIRRATLTTEPYAVPKDFDFRRYMSDAFSVMKGGRPVEVAIRFAPRQARWMRERKWHRSARVQEELDGALILRLRVSETSEIKRWVLQFGSEATVLAPGSLRKEIERELRTALGGYRKVER